MAERADYEDRLHAVRSSLSAIAGAVHVLGAPAEDADSVRPLARQALHEALVAEIERLQRLVAPVQVPSEASDIDLDSLFAALALTRHGAGQVIEWMPTGLSVRGIRDELIEILTVLLVNAERHAPGAVVHLDAETRGNEVELIVHDDGPGVPDDLRGVIFQRGNARPTSSGQGLGLAVAVELVQRMGGGICLCESAGGGASFAISLPMVSCGGAA